jgi:hypothetical protein
MQFSIWNCRFISVIIIEHDNPMPVSWQWHSCRERVAVTYSHRFRLEIHSEFIYRNEDRTEWKTKLQNTMELWCITQTYKPGLCGRFLNVSLVLRHADHWRPSSFMLRPVLYFSNNSYICVSTLITGPCVHLSHSRPSVRNFYLYVSSCYFDVSESYMFRCVVIQNLYAGSEENKLMWVSFRRRCARNRV